MARTERIYILVSSAEKERIVSKAHQRGLSLSKFLRELALADHRSIDLEPRLGAIQAQLLTLKFILEDELEITFSRPSDEVDGKQDRLEYNFVLLVEKLLDLFEATQCS
ncbi:plasmid mobilization protein [Sphaerothrix gracilis]|uniref:plasmid mobilization protein n=1 Tax=Sphaerothrix gracilis TaxID=3151835 RepID=UPI0031FC6E53